MARPPSTDPIPTDAPAPPREAVRGLEALVDFYLAAGFDAWIGDAPADAFAQSAIRVAAEPAPPRAAGASLARPAPARPAADLAPPVPRPAAGPSTASPAAPPAPTMPAADVFAAPTLPGDGSVTAAREAAGHAATLDELRAILARFEGCNLRLTAKSLVFGDGDPHAAVMFIGEAPGQEEDRQGVPFVGRSGQMLDRMLAAIGLDRRAVWVTNVVPWRPPGNRTPSPQETEICKPFVLRQIELVRPRILVFLGGASASAVTGTREGILRLRGRWLDVPLRREAGGGSVRALATLHPAYLLRNPLQKRLAWRDFLALRAALDAQAGQGAPAGDR